MFFRYIMQKDMKEKIKGILENRAIYFFTIITILFFGILIKIEFATDTYAVFAFNRKEIFNQFMASGRFITAIVGILLKTIKISNNSMYIGSFLLAILSMIVSQYKLYLIIKEKVKNTKLQILIPSLIILNIFSVELVLFVEKGIMIFAILMCIFAVEKTIKFFESNKKINILYATIYMFLANASYQGVVGLFVAIMLVYILKYSETIKKFIINNMIVIGIYGISAGADYILIKLLYSSSRINGKIVFNESLNKIYAGTSYMIKTTYNLFPKYLYIILIAIIFLIILHQIFLKKSVFKEKVIEILKLLYIIFGVLVATIAPQVMQSTDQIWFVSRSTYTFASLYGILILYLCINYKLSRLKEYAILCLSIVLICIQLYKFNLIEVDRYKLNAIDNEFAQIISEEMLKYEEETGNTINKIAIYEDKSTNYTYNGIFATGDINIKAFSTDWSTKAILEYYSGRKFENIEKEPKMIEYFKNNDWKKFDKEQLKFENDVLHICRY